MVGQGEKFRFFFPVVIMAFIAAGLVARMIVLHFNLVETTAKIPRYGYKRIIPGLRGSIYFANGSNSPVANTVPIWDYHVDGRALDKRHKRSEVVSIVAKNLALPKETVRKAYWAFAEKKSDKRVANAGSRYVPLAVSFEKASDPEAHEILSNKKRVSGLNIEEKSVRRYPQDNLASSVVGYVSHDPVDSVGAGGIEQRYEKWLKPENGWVMAERDANGREIPLRRSAQKDCKNGSDVYLTIDQNLQLETENALREGLVQYKAQAAWAIIMDVHTGAILTMVSLPDYKPQFYNKYTIDRLKNRAISENYEPGSVMKTVTACAVIDSGTATADTMINTDRLEEGYYRLPRDGSHKWEPKISVREALVHSSNIVYGKLGIKVGRERLWSYMKEFGFGQKTGIDLPGEEKGIFPHWKVWDKASQSRAPIGQYVAVTPIQMVNAYAAIANDGVMMKPYVVSKIIDHKGEEVYVHKPEITGKPISARTARIVREMMQGVAKKGGTARRAAVKGYTVAGKTGTAQMKLGKGYSSTDYNASFIGMIPSMRPEIVILITFQKPKHDRVRFTHQGGACAGPVFSRIATYAMSYLAVEPDVPEELPEDDDFWAVTPEQDVPEEEGGGWEE